MQLDGFSGFAEHVDEIAVGELTAFVPPRYIAASMQAADRSFSWRGDYAIPEVANGPCSPPLPHPLAVQLNFG